MSGMTILDLVAGMIFIFFLLSIICSSVVEIIMTMAKARSKILSKWLLTVFSDELGKAIMNHSAVAALSKENKTPDYIDAKNFTTALLDRITFDPKNPANVVLDLNSYIELIRNNKDLSDELKRQFLIYAAEAKENFEVGKALSQLNAFRGKIETWFDSSMQRLTGSLKKRYARPFTFIVALISILCVNADSISIAQFLYSNPDARKEMSLSANKAVSDSTWISQINHLKTKDSVVSEQSKASLDTLKKHISAEVKTINAAKGSMDNIIPLGWKDGELHALFSHTTSGSKKAKKVAGLFISIMAVMMGAPFWFDLLNKIANLRGSGKKPEESTTEKQNSSVADC